MAALSEKTDAMRIDDARHFEDVEENDKVTRHGKVDYSGAHKKTDPEEIKLVKKLDRWIMVRLQPKSTGISEAERWRIQS